VKIVRLNSQNVKRLTAVEITPAGNVIVIGGKNGQGKSSVLDSIAYVLGGKDLICRQPVRRGQKSAEVTCDLGEYKVRRTFTADGGGQLTVETKDGARFTSPQARLDDIVGRLSFDPLAFSRMDPAKQAETLRVLLGLDFTELDRERASVFAVRTDVNRDGKALRARYEALPAKHRDVPEEEVSAGEILADLEIMQEQNHVIETARNDAAMLRSIADGADSQALEARKQCDRTRQEIARLQERLVAEEKSLGAADANAQNKRAEAVKLAAAASALVVHDLAPLKERLAGVEAVNRKVRENHENARLLAELEAQRTESQKLTARIDAIDAAKQEAVAKASFPVEGLGFDADGIVTFNGLPFDQASAAEQLRVSVAIGIALNPKLRVLLIRDGSLLDEESLGLLGEMADQHDAQLWIERVEDGGATVIIEDGSVLEPAGKEASS
jgi:DNA repair exonuclease SbcCD ATPase subunit